MSLKSGPEDLQLGDYLGVLRRRWWLVAVLALIGAVGGVVYFKAAHKVYTATASVYVTATSQTVNQVANGRTTGTVNLDTEAQVVQSATVAQAAAKLMHSTAPLPELINRVSVTVPANSQVLAIACQASSPVKAASCAQSFAQAYLTYTSASTSAAIKTQISTLQSQITSLEKASAKLAVEVASLPSDSSQRAAAQEQLNSDHSQLGSLNSEVASLNSGLSDPSGGSIISKAIPPQKASSPKALLIVPSGLLVGLLIGLVLAFIAERRDRRIRGPRDLAKYDVPVLMSLPLTKFVPDMEIAAPRSPIGRDFAELAHMLAGSLGAGSHVIAVSGSAAGHGTSLIAANLAVALSRNHPDVTLVCADLEGSSITDMIGLPPGPGLTDIVTSEVQAREVGRRVDAAPRLRVITPGSVSGREADDLPLDAVERLLDELREHAEWIIVEAPAVASGPDAYTLTRAADATVLVVEVPKVRADQVLDSIQHLERTGATVLGAVLLPSPNPPVPLAIPLPEVTGSRRLALGPGLPPAGVPAASVPVSHPPAAARADADEDHDKTEVFARWSGPETDDDHDATETDLGQWSAPEEASSPRRGS